MRLQFTAAGRAALVNAEHTGTRTVTVTQIGVTEQGFIPDPEGGDLVLPGERKRLETFGGLSVAPDVIHVTVRDETDDAYSLRGIGLYLDDGTLLCLYGQNETLLEKSSQALMLLSADMALAEIDATQIQFGSTEFINPPATVEVQGVVELATDQEAITGTDPARAVTPAALRATLDDRLGGGAPTALSKDLLAAATSAAMRALLALKDEGHGNGLDADLLDGQHGEFYLDWANMIGVPASTHIPGQVFAFAGAQAPRGTLPCNGAQVSRESYPALFAAIGTRYGAGDGSSTFNLPHLIDGTVPVHQGDQDLIGSTTAGAAISHTHEATTAEAGAHAHGASSGEAGDHIHATWTDGQGNHAHSGSTSGDGGHTHVFGSMWQRYGSGGDLGFHENNSGVAQTNQAGHHAHSFSTDWQGHHAHNVAMNGSGHHAHPIYISETGGHAHTTTIGATGGSSNLPAGVHMLYCIVY